MVGIGNRSRALLGVAAIAAMSAAVVVAAGASVANADVAKHRIGSFDAPTYVTHAPGAPSFLYVVERPGRIAVLRNGHRLKGSFLDIHGRVSTDGERGLLSMAFDPRYAKNRLFYVYYTNSDGNIEVDRFGAKSNAKATAASRHRVIVIPHPVASNHNGGTVAFGPDGDLYLATGDGGFAGDPNGHGQSRKSLLGKILRIDPHAGGKRAYRIPKSNPFVGKPGRNEIYALGLRNPFRFSFSRGHILIGDVGQNAWEEVDYISRKRLDGANFGWNHFEGRHVYDSQTPRPKHNYHPPILEYEHSSANCASFGGCAVTGGVVVRDRRLRGLRGRYLYADFYKGEVRSFVPHSGHARRDRSIGLHVDHPSSFGTGAHNHVYVTSLDGPVYRLIKK
jgi:glucose/arabinose dehydrogenase